MRNFRRPGIWLGIIAIVLAMGGSAVAASKITGAQIKDSTITTKDIKNGTIQEADLANDASLEGPAGARGAAGPAGPAGAPGAAGGPGLANITSVDSAHVTLQPGQYTTNGLTAYCPAGQTAIGTGFNVSVGTINFITRYGSFVGGFAANNSNIAITVWSQAICANVAGAVASSANSAERNPEYQKALKQARARIACKSAKIGGANKCIARGQFCAIRNQRDYKRYGFTCKKDNAGRYRLR